MPPELSAPSWSVKRFNVTNDAKALTQHRYLQSGDYDNGFEIYHFYRRNKIVIKCVIRATVSLSAPRQEYENQEWPRVPERKISVEGDMLWHNPNRGVSRGLDVKACRPRLISSDRPGTRGHSWFFFSLNIDNKTHFVSISITFWCLTHLYAIHTRD